MRLIRKINPCVMAVCKNEANNNFLVFMNHFIEALIFNGAYDCVVDSMDHDDPNRIISEPIYFKQYNWHFLFLIESSHSSNCMKIFEIR